MNTLAAWERHLETLSPPSHIELGLERVAVVWSRLEQQQPRHVLTVAGTNGKGSTVETAGLIAQTQGLRYGQYTSPHLHHIHERIRVAGQPVSDDELVAAFGRVDSARDSVFLTYFEFLTLAALVIFQDHQLDLWILEIGLGGRLDAVNVIDPDVSVITSIGLDHQAYLGTSEEAIAREKAGVMRAGVTTFSAAINVRKTLDDEAVRQGGLMRWLDEVLEGSTLVLAKQIIDLTRMQLPKTSVALASLAMEELGYHITTECLVGLEQAQMLGRMSRYQIGDQTWILDVGHNPLACEFVTQALVDSVETDHRVVIFGALSDKDAESMLPILQAYTSRIALVGIDGDRGRSVDSLVNLWSALFGQTCWRSFATLKDALEGLSSELKLDDQVLIMGSFVLVADALKHDLFN
ncbi:MAG: bifunctional folylpolyglutamate synthase/dihydrofolate synthase [Litoricola sp.]|nr:bifunctional folylpolyglutamate synthase/dihydrofolate synthase [Litorivicinus sp.]